MSTTNILNRLINAIQNGFAQLGFGHGLAEGAGACGPGYAVFSGTDPRAAIPYVNQLVIGNNGGPGTPVCDGWITYAMPDCAKTVYIDSIEVLEHKYPIRFEGSACWRTAAVPAGSVARRQRAGVRPVTRVDAGVLLRRLRRVPAGRRTRRR